MRGHVTFGYSHLVMSFLYLLLSTLFLYYLHAVRKLTCSNDFRDKHRVLKLMVGARGRYHLPDNVISEIVGLVYIGYRVEQCVSSHIQLLLARVS